jgi:hypothetical protein
VRCCSPTSAVAKCVAHVRDVVVVVVVVEEGQGGGGASRAQLAALGVVAEYRRPSVAVEVIPFWF